MITANTKIFIRLTALAVLAGPVIGLGACTPTMISDTAQAAFEDRLTEDQITDARIAGAMTKALFEKDKNLVLDVGIDVWEQRVLLTGTLDGEHIRQEVLALAGKDDRIKSLYNEIQVVPTAERDQRRAQAENPDADAKEGIGQTVNDYWIETKIKGKLVATKGVTSINYRWRSVKNDVYLIGRARSEAELNKVMEIIRDTDGVRNIKQYVEIKPIL